MNDYKTPQIIHGGSHTDERGIISFVNDFKFEGVNRFYTIHHPDKSIIRAWQGHTHESKYYYPVKGKWGVAWVKMDFEKDENMWIPQYKMMDANDSNLIFLPSGYANGFKALENDSIIVGFSVPGKTEEKKNLRWDKDKWLDWNSYF